MNDTFATICITIILGAIVFSTALSIENSRDISKLSKEIKAGQNIVLSATPSVTKCHIPKYCLMVTDINLRNKCIDETVYCN